jgi:formylglycine-generating enzyme required for sulfatase activity
VERLSVTGPAAAWRQAIATIADRGQCPAYDGLQIAPQPGFVPLGRDEHSRLYEFAFLQPGLALPQRRDGRWLVAEDTCMVFVLIPGGVARLGLDWPAAGLPADLGRPVDTEYLPHDDGTEGGRGFGLRLDPFLLSKYEMTHAQWEALMGTAGNPSTYSPERQTKYGLTRTHPVNTIDALLADEAMRRLDLTLPTSAQWQYAARGGAEGPWWTGCSPQGWHGAENLADRSLAQVATKLEFGECDTSWDDTFTLTAPVDSLQPNPFGLHHVLGNVREWSRDPAHKYKDAMPREGDGLMMPLRAGEVLDPRKRDVLGGSFQMGWLYTRSTIRTEVAAQQASRTFGLRPTRALAARAGR